jgi:hypothetical protein
MQRNYSAYLNQSLLIHNMHLLRRMQQFMDYFLSVAGNIHTIEQMLASGNPDTVKSGRDELKKIRIEFDAMVLSLRGTSQPPSKEDILAFAGSFVAKPRRKPEERPVSDVEVLESDIKKILDEIFGDFSKQKETETPPPPPDNKKINEKILDDLPDPEDLEDFLKGL